jgi:hypothetical protein
MYKLIYIIIILKLKPLNLMKVTKSMVSSSKCSRETIRRRSNELSKIRSQIAMGDSTIQFNNELKQLPIEERKILMKEANFTISIPPEQGLAMKADLNIPWNKLRIMRRYYTKLIYIYYMYM